MLRRNLLRTAGLAAGLAFAGGPATATSDRQGPAPDDRWFLDWLPPSLAGSETGYSLGANLSPPGAGETTGMDGSRYVRLVTDQAMLTAAIGADPGEEREKLQSGGYERLAGEPRETYGRSTGRRYRVATLDEAGVVSGTGPARRPILERVQEVAGTDGTADPGRVLEGLFEYVLPARHLSVDVQPVAGVAGVGERVTVDGDRTRIRTVVLQDPAVDGWPVESYLDDVGDVDGVLSTDRSREGRALVRETTVRTTVLRAGVEGAP